MDDAPFVFGDGAKRAAAKTAAHDVDGKANHLPRRNFGRPVVAALRVGIRGVRAAGVGEAKDPVHLGGGEGNGGRRDPHVTRQHALAMRLHQGAGVARIGFQVQHAVGVGIQHGVAFDLLIAGQTNDGALARRHFHPLALQFGWRDEVQRLRLGPECGGRFAAALTTAALDFGLFGSGQVGVEVAFDAARLIDCGRVHLHPVLGAGVLRSAHEGRAAHVGDVVDGGAGGEAVRDFDQRTLGIAVQQQIAFAVHDDAAADFIAPIIVVGDAAQAAFDAAQHNGHIREGFAAALAIDDGGAVGALAAHIARRVGIVAADFAVGRVAVDHAVHVARRHAPKEIGFAQGAKWLGTRPIGLGDDADAKALRLQHAPNHRHAKTGVIDVSVAGDEDDVATVPAQLHHLLTRHGQEGRNPETLGPKRAVAGQGFGCTRKKRDIDKGIHRRIHGAECKAQGPNVATMGTSPKRKKRLHDEHTGVGNGTFS